MRIYVLTGPANSGKTTTLNTLADFVYRTIGASLGTMCSAPHINNVDDQYYFDYTRSSGAVVRIGISTTGDSPDCIDQGFDFFKTYNCDVCFMASRTRGETICQVENQCHTCGIKPFYRFLIWHTDSVDASGIAIRSQTAIQRDIVADLAASI